MKAILLPSRAPWCGLERFYEFEELLNRQGDYESISRAPSSVTGLIELMEEIECEDDHMSVVVWVFPPAKSIPSPDHHNIGKGICESLEAIMDNFPVEIKAKMIRIMFVASNDVNQFMSIAHGRGTDWKSSFANAYIKPLGGKNSNPCQHQALYDLWQGRGTRNGWRDIECHINKPATKSKPAKARNLMLLLLRK